MAATRPLQAEILTIGTELLLGEVVDTNTAVVARWLREIGANLFRTTTVGDNVERIAQAVAEALSRSDVLITTGGLGPTVDDPTREAVAKALDVPLEFRPELWRQIRRRFAAFGRLPSENNRVQAHIPAGSEAIPNPVGTAPGFIAERSGKVVVSLPGVPAEMEHLMEASVLPHLRRRFDLRSAIVIHLIRTAGVSESWIDERIGDLERLANPTVGVSAHPGRVDIRVTARGESAAEAETLLAPVVDQLQDRLGEAVYAVGSDSLERVVNNLLENRGWALAILEVGAAGALASEMARSGAAFAGAKSVPAGASQGALVEALAETMHALSAAAGLGIRMAGSAGAPVLEFAWRLPGDSLAERAGYGGPPTYAARWLASRAVDSMRRRLLSIGSA